MIYLDNAATTKVDDEVLRAMLPFLSEQFFNPSAFYRPAQRLRDQLEEAREVLASRIKAQSSEVFFTSGGTESNNFAIKQVAMDTSYKGRHIISTKIEHPSVLQSLESLEKRGFEVTYLDVNEDGVIDPSDLEAGIREDTILISVMFANNEIGSLMPIAKIGAIAKKYGILFHTDAVQAFGYEDMDVHALGIDLLTCSAHKIHGPKGVGGLYIRNGVKVKSYITGGTQEKKRRAGTEHVDGIMGFQKAIAILEQSGQEQRRLVTKMREYFESELEKQIPSAVIHAKNTGRIPSISNFRIAGHRNEEVLIQLDMNGICASGGSACTTGSLEPSHVLLALGLCAKDAMEGLRVSFSKYTTKDEIDFTIKVLKQIAEKSDRRRG